MTERNRLAAAIALLDEGYEPSEITMRVLVEREMRNLINTAVARTLSMNNVTDRDDRRWYLAQEVKTDFHASLHAALDLVMSCEELDTEGRQCVGDFGHPPPHWDGNGANWPRVGS